MRRRARHRLIGASVLVLLGVLGFPLLFDTQPRPISVDIPIEIPAKNTPPVPASAARSSNAPKPVAPAEAVSLADSLDDREERLNPAVPAPLSRTPPETRGASPARTKVEPVAAAPTRSAARSASASAPASSEDNTAPVGAEGSERFIVQVGAFAEVLRAREVRRKVEAAGLKTYTHVAEMPEGRRIRVRVGPFATRAEADKAAARIKAQGLPAAILTL